MLLLDVLLRYSSIAIAGATIFLMLRDGKKSLTAQLGAILLLTIAAFLLWSAPEILKVPDTLDNILFVVSLPILPLVWWFGLALLDDNFRLRPLHWAGMLLYFTVDLIQPLELLNTNWNPSIDLAILLLSYGLLIHLGAIALIGLKEDLVDQRRKLRLGLVLFLIFGEIITLAPTVFLPTLADDYIIILNLFITLAVVVWAFLISTRFHSEILMFMPVQEPEPKASTIDPRDAHLYNSLNALMETERVYTEHNLTIKHLADRLEVPEHQLRILINQGLGFRNFSTFLNGYRIEYAKTTLADPTESRTSILTIAMDSGFASVSSFNRVFKDLENITPTEFRSKALSSALQF